MAPGVYGARAVLRGRMTELAKRLAIVDTIRNGVSSTRAAAIHGVTKRQALYYWAQYGSGARAVGRPSHLSPQQWAVAYELIQSGDATVQEVADAYDIPDSTIREHFRSRGQQLRRQYACLDAAEKAKLIARYQAGATQRALALEFDLTVHQVRHIIEVAGAVRYTLKCPQAPQIIDAMLAGNTIASTARHFGVSYKTAARLWKKHGTGRRKPGTRKPFRAARLGCDLRPYQEPIYAR